MRSQEFSQGQEIQLRLIPTPVLFEVVIKGQIRMGKNAVSFFLIQGLRVLFLFFFFHYWALNSGPQTC
jgi:hypothetical protein